MQKKIIQAQDSQFEKWQPSQSEDSDWLSMEACANAKTQETFFEIMPAKEEVEASISAHKNSIHDEAYQKGFEQGLANGEAEKTEQLKLLQNLYDTLSLSESIVDEHVTKSLVALSLKVTRQLFYQTIENDPSLIEKLIEGALASVPANTGAIKVLLHSDDYQVIQKGLKTLDESALQFEIDPGLSRGDVVLKSNECIVDASLKERFMNLMASLDGPDA